MITSVSNCNPGELVIQAPQATIDELLRDSERAGVKVTRGRKTTNAVPEPIPDTAWNFEPVDSADEPEAPAPAAIDGTQPWEFEPVRNRT
jgi:hypothetical protein